MTIAYIAVAAVWTVVELPFVVNNLRKLHAQRKAAR